VTFQLTASTALAEERMKSTRETVAVGSA